MNTLLLGTRGTASPRRARGRGLIATWIARSRDRRRLAEMDERLLADIGLDPVQARAEANKPWWIA